MIYDCCVSLLTIVAAASEQSCQIQVSTPHAASSSLTDPWSVAYGRYLIPTQHVETILDASPEIITRQRRVFFDPHEPPSSPTRIIQGEDVAVTADELKEVQANAEWIYYKIWEMKDEFLEDKRGKGVDVVYVHGELLILTHSMLID